MPRKACFDAYGTLHHLIMSGKGFPWLDTGYVRCLLAQKLKQKSLTSSERQHTINNIIQSHRTKAGVTPEQSRNNNSAGQIPCIRSHIAHAHVGKPGSSCAEIARQLGVCYVGVLKMMKKEGKA